MKNLAVQGCTFKSTPGGAIVTPLSSPNTKCIADGKNVYMSPLSISVTYTDEEGFTGSSTASIISSAEKCKVGGQMAILEGDSVNLEMTLIGLTYPYEKIINMSIEIESAGQDRARGN